MFVEIMAGIYFHIPFCKQACHYCDFHFSTNLSQRHEVANAMASEIRLQKNYLEGEIIKTIYFGGGTPSLLSKEELKMIIETVRDLHSIDLQSEITLEVNPDDLNPRALDAFKALGINRLSIGIQSFNDKVLKFLNRAHSAASALSCVEDARAAGFQNISIDLIYAIPDQSTKAWQENIELAIKLSPEHISAYSLTIEEKTVFGKWASKGKLALVPEEDSAGQLETLVTTLANAGYRQYEVSNFAKPGLESKHNSSYWKDEKYLGIGPSAHSYNRKTRQFNVANNAEYLRAIHKGVIPAEQEQLTAMDRANDYLLTTLRTIWGVDLEKLKHDFGYDLRNLHSDYLRELEKNNQAQLRGDKLTLTSSGLMLADKIASDLFLG